MQHGDLIPYYLEGLKRDPDDIRINNAYGMLLMRRGLFKEAEPYFRTAIKRLTWKNPNPYNSEAYYLLGLDLCYLGREDEAYDAFIRQHGAMNSRRCPSIIWRHRREGGGSRAGASRQEAGRMTPAPGTGTVQMRLARALSHTSALW